jgi:aerobic carbon-monoxide dehydrogenase medium subunit
MIPAAFEYRRPSSIDEAVSLLASDDEAKLLAGGHSLLPMMRLRLARPTTLIDLVALRGELSYVRDDGGVAAIGAMTRHHDVATSELLRRRVPLLAHAASMVGDPQVRHRGTIGGSLAHADPAADLPAVALVLDATLVLTGPTGTREVTCADFFRGFLETALQPGEMLREIRVPFPSAEHGWGFVKFNRRAQDWATVMVAALLERDGGTVRRAAVGLANMGTTPLRARGVEEAITGRTEDGIDAAAQRADEGTSPASDIAASAEYRRHLARVLTGRALRQAFAQR